MPEYPKKYWWVILVALPILTALIAILPDLLGHPKRNERKEASLKQPSASESNLTPIHPEPIKNNSGESDEEQRVSAGVPHPKGTRRDEGGPPPLEEPEVRQLESVRASGLGLAPASIENPAQKRAMARRAAETLAMRNLAEAIHGSLIKSSSKTRNGQLSEDIVKTKVNAVLRLAHTIAVKENSDGSVEVFMEAPVR